MIYTVIAIVVAFSLGLWLRGREIKFLDDQLELVYAIAGAAIRRDDAQVDILLAELSEYVGLPAQAS